MDQGALTTHEGRTTMLGVARHQPRAREQRDHAREAAQKRLETQGKTVTTPQAQGVESTSTGPGTRLEQRQRTLGGWDKASKDAPHTHGPFAAAAAALGPPGERADRDVRTQTIMTVRTRL